MELQVKTKGNLWWMQGRDSEGQGTIPTSVGHPRSRSRGADDVTVVVSQVDLISKQESLTTTPWAIDAAEKEAWKVHFRTVYKVPGGVF